MKNIIYLFICISALSSSSISAIDENPEEEQVQAALQNLNLNARRPLLQRIPRLFGQDFTDAHNGKLQEQIDRYNAARDDRQNRGN